jgi:hypothetical protein
LTERKFEGFEGFEIGGCRERRANSKSPAASGGGRGLGGQRASSLSFLVFLRLSIRHYSIAYILIAIFFGYKVIHRVIHRLSTGYPQLIPHLTIDVYSYWVKIQDIVIHKQVIHR